MSFSIQFGDLVFAYFCSYFMEVLVLVSGLLLVLLILINAESLIFAEEKLI